MIKTLLYLVVFGVLFYACTTIPLGQTPTESGWPYGAEHRLTFLGHVRAIWHTEAVQDLKNGIEDKAGPAASELKKKVHDMTSDTPAPPEPEARVAPRSGGQVIDAGVLD